MSIILESAFLVIVLFFFSFMIRLPFALVRSGDDWISAWCMKNQEKKLFNYSIEDGTFNNAFFGYPVLAFIVTLIFPKKHRTKAGILLNAVYDAILCVLLFLISIPIIDNLALFETNSLQVAFLIALLYSTSPVLMPTSIRLSGLKARSFGGLLFFLLFLSFGYAYIYDSIIAYFIAGLFGVLVLLGSQMAIQAWFFTSIFLSFYYLSIIPFAFFVLTCVIAWFLPYLGVDKILFFRPHHIIWYSKSKQSTMNADRNNLKEMLATPKYLFTDFNRFITQMLAKNTLYIALLNNTALLLFGVILFFSTDSISQAISSPVLEYCLAITLAGLFTFLLTSTPWFMIVGEAERYFEFSAPFFAFLFVVTVSLAGIDLYLVIALILFQISIGMANFYYLKRGEFSKSLQDMSLTPEIAELGHFLQTLDNTGVERRAVVLPVKLSYQLSCAIDTKNIKYHHMWMCTKENCNGFQYMQEDFPGYFFPRMDFSYYKARYNANLIIIDKAYILQKDLIHLENYQLGFQNAKYVVLKM